MGYLLDQSVNKMKRLVLLMAIIVLSLLIFIYNFFKPRDYTLNYQVSDYKITEKYLKKYHTYYFQITDEVYSFDFTQKSKYTIDRKLITKLVTDDNCITPYFKNKTTNKVCAFNNEDAYYEEVFNANNSEELLTTKNNTKIYNYLNNLYAIWNYKGIDVLEKNNSRSLEIFNKDVYNNNLMVLLNEYLVFPNYNDGYEYEELIIINLNNLKKSIIKLDKSISNNSYILGTYKKSIFIVDRKNKIEYELNPYIKKIRVVGNENKMGKIYYLDGFDEISINDLVTNTLSFTYDSLYHYKVIDNTLYLTYFNSGLLTRVNDFDDGYAVKINDDKIYYLKSDTLYFYSPSTGNKVLLKNFEWHFNYENKIFILEK